MATFQLLCWLFCMNLQLHKELFWTWKKKIVPLFAILRPSNGRILPKNWSMNWALTNTWPECKIHIAHGTNSSLHFPQNLLHLSNGILHEYNTWNGMSSFAWVLFGLFCISSILCIFLYVSLFTATAAFLQKRTHLWISCATLY